MSTYAVAPDVAWVSDEHMDRDGEPTAYVAALPQGPALVLQGPACLVWLALAEVGRGTLGEVADIIADATGTDSSAIADDVAATLEGLVSRRVAERG